MSIQYTTCMCNSHIGERSNTGQEAFLEIDFGKAEELTCRPTVGRVSTQNLPVMEVPTDLAVEIRQISSVKLFP
jgi:hypothetical protein